MELPIAWLRVLQHDSTVDLLYHVTTSAAWSQTSLTLPAAAAGYDVTKLRTDLNALGKTFLLNS